MTAKLPRNVRSCRQNVISRKRAHMIADHPSQSLSVLPGRIHDSFSVGLGLLDEIVQGRGRQITNEDENMVAKNSLRMHMNTRTLGSIQDRFDNGWDVIFADRLVPSVRAPRDVSVKPACNMLRASTSHRDSPG